VCLLYVDGSRASDGQGTLCLLAGAEQAGAPARMRTDCKQNANRFGPVCVVTPGLTGGVANKKAGRLTRPFVMLTAWRVFSNR